MNREIYEEGDIDYLDGKRQAKVSGAYWGFGLGSFPAYLLYSVILNNDLKIEPGFFGILLIPVVIYLFCGSLQMSLSSKSQLDLQKEVGIYNLKIMGKRIMFFITFPYYFILSFFLPFALTYLFAEIGYCPKDAFLQFCIYIIPCALVFWIFGKAFRDNEEIVTKE